MDSDSKKKLNNLILKDEKNINKENLQGCRGREFSAMTARPRTLSALFKFF